MAPPQWAYQVENFVNEPDEELVCSICRGVFCDPVMCPCDHVFCRACITKWLQSSRNCPICRKRASSASIKQTVPIIKNLIMKLMLNCHNKGLGCKAQFSVENSVSHLKECEYELVPCKNKPCKDQLFRKDLAEHETKDCPHRYIKCKKCRSKIPTTVSPEKHDCIQALQARLRDKSELIKKKNMRIRQLRNENKRLKTASEDSARLQNTSRFRRQSQDRDSSLSPPPELLMYRDEFSASSSYLSSDSDEMDDRDSSENNIIIITNNPYQSDENAESESSTDFMDNETSVEYSRNESPRASAEYRNVESQTLDDLPSNVQQRHSDNARSDSSSFANENTAAEASNSVSEATGEGSRPRRPVKRRPTTQKPAKRRYPQVFVSSEEEEEGDESEQHSSPQSSKQCWNMSSPETDRRGAENSEGDSSGMAAGPSCSATGSNGAKSEETSNTKWHFWSRSKLSQKRGKHTASGTNENTASGTNENTASGTNENTASNSSLTVPSRNAVFERTLALLEQYNLESDPEWLPEYASHRGNGTTDSDSSSEFEPEFRLGSSSSSSDDYTSDLNDDADGKQPNSSSAFKWLTGQSTSEDDDPDWDPICYLQNKKRLGEK